MQNDHYMAVEKLKQYVFEGIPSHFKRTNYSVEKRFSIFDGTLFYEYQIGASEWITIGIHRRRGEQESHVLMLDYSIKRIQENIEKYTAGLEKVLPFLVFSVDLTKKNWLKIKPERGNYVNGSLLTGEFKEFFDAIISAVHRLHSELTVSVPGHKKVILQ